MINVGSIGEYHKLHNPPINDSQFSKTRQHAHLSFTIMLSLISLISAIATTVIFLLPPIALSISIFSVLLCVGLGISAFEFWLDSNFGSHKPPPIPGSYHQMSKKLLQSCTPIPENSPEPNFKNGFSWSQKTIDDFVIIERNDLINQDDLINQNVNNQEHGFQINSSL
ncbi:MAG: hypothetical protein HYX60_02780 [Legionella longbeachae]|nr:hypothetical protein [Legionella longbeachae]